MRPLLLTLLIILAFGAEALTAERTSTNKNVGFQATPYAAQPIAQDVTGEKKLQKRSYGFPLASYGYTSVLPWFRYGTLNKYYGLYGYGVYPDWPLLYGGWYKGW